MHLLSEKYFCLREQTDIFRKSHSDQNLENKDMREMGDKSEATQRPEVNTLCSVGGEALSGFRKPSVPCFTSNLMHNTRSIFQEIKAENVGIK